MPLWGNGTNANEKKPVFLKGQYPQENCYMTSRGWTYRYPDGHEEVLVALNNAESLMGESSLSGITWDITNKYANTVAQSFFIAFNERVLVSGLAPTFAMSGAGNQAATYSAPTITGTVTTATTTNTVVGVGTKFKTQLAVNDRIYTAAGVYVGKVAAILSDLSAVLFANSAAVISGAAYLKSENKLKFTFTPTATGAVTIAVTTATNIASIKSADTLSAAEVTKWTAAMNTAFGSKTIV